jgi:hypothetical protein
MTKTYEQRIQELEEKTQGFRTIREFYMKNPYLYRWALKHNVHLAEYFPKRRCLCNIEERENKGIDCYLEKNKRFYKHYEFIADAMRELDLSYYYVNRVLNGIIPHIEGYVFKRCE